MNPRLHEEMLTCVTELRDDKETRVLVLSGIGDSFCAGMDLQEYFMAQRGHPSRMAKSRDTARRWMEELRTFPKITIAAVNGWCVGAGVRVMGLNDLAFASERATFSLSEINFGMIPAGGVSKVVTSLINPRDAAYLILTGEKIDAKRAYEMRLVNEVVPHESLFDKVYALAKKVKDHNPLTVRLAKEVSRQVRTLDDPGAYDYENAKVEELNYLQSGEWINVGLKSFKEKKFKPALGSYTKSARIGK